MGIFQGEIYEREIDGFTFQFEPPVQTNKMSKIRKTSEISGKLTEEDQLGITATAVPIHTQQSQPQKRPTRQVDQEVDRRSSKISNGSEGYTSVLTPQNNVLLPMGKSLHGETGVKKNYPESSALQHANSAYEDLAISTLPNATSPDPKVSHRNVLPFDPGVDTDRESKGANRTNNNFFSTDEAIQEKRSLKLNAVASGDSQVRPDGSYSTMVIPTGGVVHGGNEASSDHSATPMGKKMDITIHQKHNARSKTETMWQAKNYVSVGINHQNNQQTSHPDVVTNVGQPQFFKLSSDDRMRSQALRRRQNKLYMNKLPKKQGKEVVLVPSTQHATTIGLIHPMQQAERAANGLQFGGAFDSKTEFEVAAWMGLQRDRNDRPKEVAMHMKENHQRVRAGAELSHHHSAKPTGENKRKLQWGTTETSPLISKKNQTRMFQQNITDAARSSSQVGARRQTYTVQKSNLVTAKSKDGAQRLNKTEKHPVFDSEKAYLNQVAMQAELQHQSTDIVRSEDWEGGSISQPVQHMSSINIGKSLDNRFANLDRLLLNKIGQKVEEIKTKVVKNTRTAAKSQKYSYGRPNRSFNNSKRNSSEGTQGVEHNGSGGHKLTKGLASTTDVNTNFESLIARYQSARQMKVAPHDGDEDGGVGRRRKKSMETGQAQKFKSILEHPIGRMWFPSLGNVGAVAGPPATSIPVSRKGVANKIALNSKLQGGERAKTHQRQRDQTNMQKSQMSTIQSHPVGFKMPESRETSTGQQKRAQRVFNKIGDVIENQERLESRLKQNRQVKVKRSGNTIQIVPKTELDMRDYPVEIMTSPHSLVLKEQGALTTEQQDLLQRIAQYEQQPQPAHALISDPSSPFSTRNPAIFVQKPHDYSAAMRNFELSEDKLIGAQLIAVSKKQQEMSRQEAKQIRDSPVYMYGKPSLQRQSFQRSSTHSSTSPKNQIVDGRGKSISQAGWASSMSNQNDLHPKHVFAREYQVSARLTNSSAHNARGVPQKDEDDMTEQEMQETMQYVHTKLKEQIADEERYLKEMQVVKTNSKTFAHKFHRINPRSKVNLYVTRGSSLPATQAGGRRPIQPTVEGSLLKSRLITNRWLNQVSRKKTELQEKMYESSKYEAANSLYGAFNTLPSAQQAQTYQANQHTIDSAHQSLQQDYIQNSNMGRRDKLKASMQNENSMFSGSMMQDQSIHKGVHNESSDAAGAINIPLKAPASYHNAPQLYQGDVEDGLGYQDGLTGKAFEQLGVLKKRIERQHCHDVAKKKKQFMRVTEGMQQTQLMRDVEQEREILRLQEERLKEESKTNPDVLLSYDAMAEKCTRVYRDIKKLYYEGKAIDNEDMPQDMKDEIEYAMQRQEMLGVPMFKQDFAFRLVKLNQIEHSMWGTEFVKRVQEMMAELDVVNEAGNAVLEQRQLGQRAAPGVVGQQRESQMQQESEQPQVRRRKTQNNLREEEKASLKANTTSKVKHLDSMTEEENSSDGDRKKRTPKPSWIREGSATRAKHQGCSGRGDKPQLILP